jgi:hypothetical protein
MSHPETVTNIYRREKGTRDGLFQRRGWWWLDYHDADGKRHRKKAAPDSNGEGDSRQTLRARSSGPRRRQGGSGTSHPKSGTPF